MPIQIRDPNLPKPGSRARSAEAKSARRQSILKAALKLFTHRPFEMISMNDVANAAKVAKGTVYLYFSTKEELFLALIKDAYERWFHNLDTALQAGLEWRELPKWLANELDSEPQFLSLLCLLHAVLEQNIEPLTARDFKLWVASRLADSTKLMNQRYPWLQTKNVELLMLQIQCIAIGAAQMARPSEVMTKVLKAEELACLRIEFKPFFEATVAALFESMPRPR